jgi:hypothetical protein
MLDCPMLIIQIIMQQFPLGGEYQQLGLSSKVGDEVVTYPRTCLQQQQNDLRYGKLRYVGVVQ